MITIEQRKFEGRENPDSLLPSNANQPPNKSAVGNIAQNTTQRTRIEKEDSKNKLSKEVEKVFERICASLELHTADNLPIITEFLEF